MLCKIPTFFREYAPLRKDLLILEDEDVDAAVQLNMVEKRKLKNLLKTLQGGSSHESIELFHVRRC